jgi:Glycosyltransferase family 87
MKDNHLLDIAQFMSNPRSIFRLNWERWISRFAFLVFGSISFFWAHELFFTRFECTLHQDWVLFHDTARLLLSSRVHEIYPGVTTNLPFFYPPYFIPLIAPLGFLSRTWAYVTIALSMIGAMSVAVHALRNLLPTEASSFAAGVLVVLSSASWNAMIISGHLSALYLLILVAGLLFWSRGHRLLAGAVLSLMMFKPNIGLIFPALFVAKRQWSLAAGWACGFALLLTSTVPIGLGIWVDYFGSYRSLASALSSAIPMWRQQTIYAFWRTALGMPQSTRLLALWAFSTLPLLAATVAAWIKVKPDSRQLPRLFGIAVLAVVCCNTYLFVYDGLLLALPGIVWHVRRSEYRSAACHRTAGIAMLVIYIWQHLSTWFVHGAWPLVGPAAGLWLIAEAWDLIRGPTRAGAECV